MEGTLYIDIDSYEILKMHGTIRNDNLELVALNNPMGSWKNLVLEFDVAYKPMDDQLFLDYITVTQSFDYYVDDVFHHPVKTNSFLTYYEYYTPEKFKRLGGRIIRYGNRDRDMLDRIGYNRRFWEDNPVVMRTPVEEEVISSFEAQNAFGSIYLNDRDQVQLENDELDQDPFIQQIKIDLRKSKLPTSGEKVYLHTDLPVYASGETIWFNAYIVNLATHVPSNLSGVLYVDLISPEGNILVNKRLDVEDAYAEGNIDLPGEYRSGRYRLRAYTNWMRNYDAKFYFDKELDIYNADKLLNSEPAKVEESQDFDVQFLPEGGNLINGIAGQVAFKAIDEHGKGIEVSGKIVNEKGNQVAQITTRHDGMGSFFFMPQPGMKFSAEVRYHGHKKVYPLPEALPSGYCLTVNNLKDKSIQVMVKASPDLNDSEFYLIGQTRGVLYHREKGIVTRGNAMINIPKSKIPDGIFQITLFDSLHAPRCERLVFIHDDPGIFVDMKNEPDILQARDRIKLQFELTDQFDRGIRDTRFSLAVTDAGHIMKQATDENIMTYLLLTSDLRGRIENPGFYFLDDDRDTRIALDLLMLTHGWRRFTWQEIFDGTLAETPFNHERGLNLTGKAMIRGTKSPLKNAYINLMSIRPNFPGYWSTTTDVQGNFKLTDLQIPDTLQAVTISVDAKGKPMNIALEIDSIMPAPAARKEYQKYPPPVNENIMNYLNRYNERDKIADAYHYSNRVVMKEIEVRGRRDDYEQTIYGEPDAVIKMDDQLRAFTDIFQILQGRIPGVTVTGQGVNATIRIRGVNSFTGNTDPLIVVDGLPISNIGSTRTSSATDTSNTASSGPDFNTANSILLSISPMDVDRIEVLKGASAAAYGSRGGNGVILIYTRRGGEEPEISPNQGYGDIILPGLSYTREFYSPAYDVPSEEHIMPDKRTTLYWDPDVRTNNLGQAVVGFFNSDDARKLQVEIQGVTDYGDIIHTVIPLGSDLIK
jgi:TonB-dependent SusC/RagA subfamily outer membrane receptor